MCKIVWQFLTVVLFSLFSWLFPSYRVAGITDDLPTPRRHVRLLARSQSSTFLYLWHESFHFVCGRPLFLFPVISVLSPLSSACVRHLASSHARTSSIVSPPSFWKPAPLSLSLIGSSLWSPRLLMLCFVWQKFCFCVFRIDTSFIARAVGVFLEKVR